MKDQTIVLTIYIVECLKIDLFGEKHQISNLYLTFILWFM